MMQVICLEEPAFYKLVNKVYDRLKDQHNIKQDKWINGEEAMRLLRITSKTTLQKLRDTRSIRFTDTPVILYDTDSIFSYLEKSVPKI